MDYTSLAESLVVWLREYARPAQMTGCVVGLSGGIDSAVSAALAVRAVGVENVLGVWLPCHSQPEDAVFARLTAEFLGLEPLTVELSVTYDTLLAALPPGHVLGALAQGEVLGAPARGKVLGAPAQGKVLAALPPGHVLGAPARGNVLGARTQGNVLAALPQGKVLGAPAPGEVLGAPAPGKVLGAPAQDNDMARANLKPRLRMATLYYLAQSRNALVLGTGNRAEMMVGYFTKYGDGGVDLEPLGELYKHEVRQLARVLGVPEPLITRPPTAGLWPGQTDEGELGITYDELDAILAALEAGREPDALPAAVARVRRMAAASAHKRAMPPAFPVERVGD